MRRKDIDRCLKICNKVIINKNLHNELMIVTEILEIARTKSINRGKMMERHFRRIKEDLKDSDHVVK